MTNENIDRNRFLSVFRREWEMYKTREADPARKPSGTQALSSATFDQPVAGGELRVFADFPSEALRLLDARTEARKAKDWARADAIRNALHDMGFAVEDSAQGPKLKKL